jgi:hypothetical protein
VVRRCDKGGDDTFPYTTSVRAGQCNDCGSVAIVQHRTYTPDFHIVRKAKGSNDRGYYLEVKGHFPGPQRNLVRAFLEANGQGLDLRILLQRDGKATPKLMMSEYIEKYIKVPWHVWDGQLPKDWR